jgi:RNA polymerase sigma-70 factor, ECF subfamily
MAAQSDRDLLHAMAKGEVRALDELYARYARGILSYLVGLLGDRQLAEEVLQDVMLAAWRGAGQFRGESQVRTWLLSIARLQALSALRGRKLLSVPLDEGVLSAGNTDGFDPDVDHQTIRVALKELPSEQRETLELIFYHELSGVEAAAVLGVSPGTVKSRLSRAKSTLRGLLLRRKEGIE